MSQAESQKCPPPTKKETAPAREQDLANGRVKHQLYQTQRQIAEEETELEQMEKTLKSTRLQWAACTAQFELRCTGRANRLS